MTSLSFTDHPGVDEAWWFVIRARTRGRAGSHDASGSAPVSGIARPFPGPIGYVPGDRPLR
jgi:hypothetical protein